MGGVFIKFQNVKPPWTNVKSPYCKLSGDFLAPAPVLNLIWASAPFDFYFELRLKLQAKWPTPALRLRSPGQEGLFIFFDYISS